MIAHDSKFTGEGLTYDDVLLVPAYSGVLPREVSIQTKFTRNISINVPIVSAAMDTVTESAMAIAIARGRDGSPTQEYDHRGTSTRGEKGKTCRKWNDYRSCHPPTNGHCSRC